ncbi:hypothetical protein [Nonomuraea harbinensis]|uniref:Uncharacterized protein n=1 Tax=Nonomuraea harbinensis TaxID=1286938 RepID=A0ABW1BX50_9ACTN|nr:hypothetical protein [Nonomuraea harbinensis]
MARKRATAVSAMVLAIGLTGIGVIPFVGAGATASATALDPVEPCDVGQECPPQTTVTITTTLPTPTPEPEQPETTITKTVTAKPTKTTKAPEPTKTKTTKAPDPAPVTQSAAPPPQQLPEETPQEVPDPVTSSAEESVQMPTVAGTDTPTPALSTDAASVETDTVQLEVRNAAPEYDQRSLTQRLSIPALIMVLLALFAVLIFEGRLRRMAHAAAVRKAGPQAGAYPGAYPQQPGPYPHQAEGYPAGPGYATAGVAAPGYPGGTAYAPIISFVPVQTFPSGQVQYGAVYHDPNAPHTAPAPMPEQGPVVLAPDQYGSYSHQPGEPPSSGHQPGEDAYGRQPGEAGRDSSGHQPGEATRESYGHQPGEAEREQLRAPFEPLIAPEPPSSDIPPGGAAPYEDTPDRPLGPASAAESGDSEPWFGPRTTGNPPSDLDRTIVQRFPDDDHGPDERGRHPR